MAKSKKETHITINPNSCINSINKNDKLYCKLKLQDENILKDSGIVKVCVDCKYFKIKS